MQSGCIFSIERTLLAFFLVTLSWARNWKIQVFPAAARNCTPPRRFARADRRVLTVGLLVPHVPPVFLLANESARAIISSFMVCLADPARFHFSDCRSNERYGIREYTECTRSSCERNGEGRFEVRERKILAGHLRGEKYFLAATRSRAVFRDASVIAEIPIEDLPIRASWTLRPVVLLNSSRL